MLCVLLICPACKARWTASQTVAPSLPMKPASPGQWCQFRLARLSKQYRMTSACDRVPQWARSWVSPPHKHNSVRSPEGVSRANDGNLLSHVSGVVLHCCWCVAAGAYSAWLVCGFSQFFKQEEAGFLVSWLLRGPTDIAVDVSSTHTRTHS